MSSYKGHSLFALILSVMFFHNPLLIALTVIGANIPDFDHDFKKDNVYKMIILGLLVFISLYILKLPYYIGLIIVFLGVTFYFSEHRSFTHSIFGILTLSSSVGLILIWSYQLLCAVTSISDTFLLMSILIALVSFLFLNRKILILFLGLFFMGVFILPHAGFSYLDLVLALGLGLFSHTVLDSFTPAGVRLFAPLSSKKFYRNFGIASIFMLVVIAIIVHIPLLFEIFNGYISH